MKGFNRNDLLFSLCGLNCSLCVMKLDNYCPGCGGGQGNQGCPIARCSLQYQEIEYCFQCREYPCEKYNGIDKFDSFITHRNQLKDMKKAQLIGLKKYHLELEEKSDILKYLLKNYNDGRRKSFFCITVNLLDIQDLREIVDRIKIETASTDLTLKEKAAIAVKSFQTIAQEKNFVLKLNKKPSKNKVD
ncbi:DUF3795 domain-containing protein [Anaerocolumna sp.]|uniref:DUF3795 domain-containing protein n=1 Tax=Anaerocolumna sp. TaxID=2041569 RepID=UPI0028AA2941|nr:DUF3795 domain-containing protein [Anaerocolumna sp.]